MLQNDQGEGTVPENQAMIERYRDLLGWPITIDADLVTLLAGDVVCSADLPIGLACEVQATLQLRMLDGPVILVPGRQHRWMLLAKPSEDARVPSRPVPGVDLRVITEGAIPLPPSSTPHGPLRWVIPPSLSRPWLPALSAVMAATRAAVPVQPGQTR
ncbi:MAG TPA: hypothetical protein VFQ77_21330 [Pseudonocardiaceae bacterium]|jgi:hypothetical protein|nr:hypothetical protein [Pseudonocardiaceae bacterium]